MLIDAEVNLLQIAGFKLAKIYSKVKSTEKRMKKKEKQKNRKQINK